MDQKQNIDITDLGKCLTEGKLMDFFSLALDYLRIHTPAAELGGDVENILRDYQMMMSCFKDGIDDPQRQLLLDRFVKKAEQLYNCLQMVHLIFTDATMAAAYKRSAHIDICMASDYLANHEYDDESVNKIFSAILVSSQWSLSTANSFTDLLLDPRTPQRVSAVLISAIMLSSLCVCDLAKIECLISIYTSSPDVCLRERALIGWVFCACFAEKISLNGVRDRINALVASHPDTLHELYEMQKQIIYCMDAEKDASEVSKSIMQNMPTKDMMRDLKGDFDDFSVDEILHPEQEEEAMERFEQSVEKMIKMQKEGSDIYFDGFSKMKSFSFFHRLSNWFMPFYAKNPALDKLREALGSDTFVKNLEKAKTFCDGDKYSFCFGIETTLRSHMDVLKPLLQESFMFTREELSKEDEANPAIARRMMLQDLFRFFKVSPFKGTFPDVFSERFESAAFFLGRNSFKGVDGNLKLRMKICNFLCKRKDFVRMAEFREADSDHLEEMFMSSLYYIYGVNDYDNALALLKKIPAEGNVELPVRKALAKCYFENMEYSSALEQYAKIQTLKPSFSVAYKMAYCMLKSGKVEEAMSLLYEMDYKKPNNVLVMRALAWGNVLRQKYDEALKLYDQILALCQDDKSMVDDDDVYNRGLCLWLQKDFKGACSAFADYLALDDNGIEYLRYKLGGDFDMLKQAGFSYSEIGLMVDCVASML